MLSETRPSRVATDTNVVLGTLEGDPQSESCRRMVESAERGLIDLAVTPTVDMDDERGHATRFVVSGLRAGFPTEIPPAHRGEHYNPAAPPPMKPDPVLEGRIIARLRPEAGGDWRTLGTNDKKDVDHSMSHAQNGRDIFITNDRRTRRRGSCLRESGMVAATPMEFTERWNQSGAHSTER